MEEIKRTRGGNLRIIIRRRITHFKSILRSHIKPG